MLKWGQGLARGLRNHCSMERPEIPSEFRLLAPDGGPLARYDYAGTVFALLPGGEVTLGFSGRWEPNAEELESWKGTQEEYDLPGSSPPEFIATVTTPERTVHLPPLLMEVEVQDPQWVPWAKDDPLLARVEDNPAVCDGREFSDGRRTLKVIRERDGSLRGFSRREQNVSYLELMAELARQGFRLPLASSWRDGYPYEPNEPLDFGTYRARRVLELL